MAVEVVLAIVPSPKSHKRLVIVPVEMSVKETVSGVGPVVGLAVKAAAGTMAPVPLNALVLTPPLAVLKLIRLVKLAAAVGAKLTTTLVEPKPARLNGVPDRTV